MVLNPDIAQLLQSDAANPMPQSSPIPQSNPFDLASIVSQVSSLPQYQQATSQLGDVYNKEGDIQQQQQQLEQNPPKTRWQPHYEPVTGVGSFLKDAGKGILQALSVTGPGQSVQNSLYGPGVQDWERKREMLASQLGTLRGQQEVPEEELRGLTGLTQAGGMAAYRGGELNVQQQRVNSYNQRIQNQLMTSMRGLDLKALMTGSQMELNKARTVLDSVLAQTAPERLQLQQYGIDTNNQTRMAVANVMSQMGIDRTHPLAQMFDQLLGTSMTPSAPQTPGGAQPVSGESPLPQRGKPTAKPQTTKSAQPPGGQMYKRMPNGKVGKWNGTTYQ